jgi:His/Glu/Gln/Arg/opine family amino acid ABC transporter permease subunit
LNYYFNFDVVWRDFDKLLWGLALGLGMAVFALAVGALIGFLAALARNSRIAPLRWLIWLYVELIRNSPLLLLLFLVFFGLPELGISFLDKVESFVVTLALYAGAYLTEVFRAGLAAVPTRYIEAAKAIGLTGFQRQFYVVIPIMFRSTLPALGSNFVSLFKDTSLAAAISVPELTFEARQINVHSFRVFETWSVASALYLVTCYTMLFGLRRLERSYAMIR